MKKFFVRFLVALLVLQSAVAAQLLSVGSAKAADETVVINEVMWMGSTASAADEWIELRNTTANPIDVSGWKLTNAATSAGTLTLPASSLIPAHGYFLVANYDKTESVSVLDVTADLVTTTISLSNTCSQINLTTASDTIVDSMGCNGSSYFQPATSATKHALERNQVITDGLLSTSWHERATGVVHIDAAAVALGNLATPKAGNDATAPQASGLPRDTDGNNTAIDLDYTVSETALFGAWDIFDDPITSYEVSFATSSSGPFSTWQNFGSIDHGTVTTPLNAGQTYYLAVKATNEVGLTSSVVVSDGAAHLNPEAPTSLTAADEPGDNGGAIRLQWQESSAIDVANYMIEYQKVGSPTSSLILTGPTNTLLVTNVESFPTAYQFSLKAIDWSGLESVTTGPTAPVSAQDNLVPTLNIAKVVIGQNRPGTNDTIGGMELAVNEPVTVNVFDRDPSTGAAPLGAVDSNANGSFPGLTVGDNKTAVIYVQLIDKDAGVVPSTVYQFQNDIVGPAAAKLTNLASRCESDTCRVNLSWNKGSDDSATFKVAYTANSVETRTFEVSGTAMALDLAAGKTYDFAVYAYDQYGNESVTSNVFTVALVKGVITSVTLENGKPITKTEAVAGTPAVIHHQLSSTRVQSSVLPKAMAAEPQPTSVTTVPLVESSTNSDWVRILVIGIILALVGISFYGLSRTLQPTPEEEFEEKKEAQETPVEKTNRKRPRRKTRR